jgi:hypothetical protein
MTPNEPLTIALIKTYANHRRFFYLNYFQDFKLFVSWLTEEEVGDVPVAGTALPWYRNNYELNELAKILKLTPIEVLGTLEDINDDY